MTISSFSTGTADNNCPFFTVLFNLAVGFTFRTHSFLRSAMALLHKRLKALRLLSPRDPGILSYHAACYQPVLAQNRKQPRLSLLTNDETRRFVGVNIVDGPRHLLQIGNI